MTVIIITRTKMLILYIESTISQRHSFFTHSQWVVFVSVLDGTFSKYPINCFLFSPSIIYELDDEGLPLLCPKKMRGWKNPQNSSPIHHQAPLNKNEWEKEIKKASQYWNIDVKKKKNWNIGWLYAYLAIGLFFSFIII